MEMSTFRQQQDNERKHLGTCKLSYGVDIKITIRETLIEIKNV